MSAQNPQMLQLSGALDQFQSFQSTPCIGTEFPKANLAEWLRAANSDELIRDLAITLAQRGVVFFRAQTQLTGDLHKELIYRLGQLSTRPKENGLWKHPLYQSLGEKDPELNPLDNSRQRSMYGKEVEGDKLQSARMAWHSDVAFEPNPPDYSSLRLTELPKGGGDTMWASGYEVYDRLSGPFQRLLEGLTATFSQQALNQMAQAKGIPIFEGPRGSPENVGTAMKAVHPVVRTHPVTGWKSVFAGGTHCQRINSVTSKESEYLIDKVMQLIVENHDLQVRFRWENSGDLAIWDNRCVYHAPTLDVQGPRNGWRVIGVGEKPYLDPNSMSRAEALAQRELETGKGAAMADIAVQG